jgi:hypothetical protein
MMSGVPTTIPNLSRAFVTANKTTMSASNNSYIVSWSYFKMEIVRPKAFVKETMQTQVTVPAAKDTETSRAFQWMLYKPQLHAVAPFETNKPSRDGNSVRPETDSAKTS